jgi:restriction endonuclease S subunit
VILKIADIGSVIHGVTLSRIESKALEERETYKLFTIQELNEEISMFPNKTEDKVIEVSKERFDSLYLAKDNMVIIGLTSFKAIAVTNKQIGKVIPSNFAFIELDVNKAEPAYFSWYFNEHSNIEKQLQIAMQGTIIRALSVQMLRELEIILPSLDVQRAVGKVYELNRKKEKLLYEKSILEEQLYKGIIMRKLKEENKICH